MAIGLVKDSSARPDDSQKGLDEIADGHGCRKRPPRPGEGTPKGGAPVLASAPTPGQQDYFVALALQQQGQQSALRKGGG